MPVLYRFEVFLFNPTFAFIGMASNSPAPEGLEDGMIDLGEDGFTDHVLVVLRPASDDRVEHGDDLACRGLAVGVDELPHLGEKPFHTFPGRFDEQLAVVLPHILP